MVMRFIFIALGVLVSSHTLADFEFSVTAEFDRGLYEKLEKSPRYSHSGGELDVIIYGWAEGAGKAEIITRVPLVGGQFSFEGSAKSPMIGCMKIVPRSFSNSDFKPAINPNMFIIEPADISIRRAFSGVGVVTGGPLNKLLLGCGEDADCQKALSAYGAVFEVPVPISQDMALYKDYLLKRSVYLGNLVQDLDDERARLLALQVEIFNPPFSRDYSAMWKSPMIEVFARKPEVEGWLLSYTRSQDASYQKLLKRTQLSEASNFEAVDVAGKKTTLFSQMDGKRYVLLEYWASWCVPCRKEFPHLKKAYQKYKGQGLEVVSFSLDESVEDWRQATEEEEIPWVNLGSGVEHDATAKYHISPIPWSYLIDCKTKRVVARSLELRGKDLDNTLAQYFD